MRSRTPTHLLLLLSIFCSSLYLSSSSSSSSKTTPPPLPMPPLPSASQLQWQLGEMALFLHFGTNTFTDREWGTGHADPAVFNPSALDARQWARAAAAGGFSRLVLTVKHHDGFCLWPSEYTNYTVASSPWKGGSGDVVAELAKAAREEGVGMGVYLSPWDRHDPSYGKTREYNEYYLGQMRELLSGYGEIREVWLDGAKGKGEKDMVYMFNCWFEFIHQLQQGAVIFSDAGPDSRWVGDEAGVAGSTCWSLFNQSSVTIGQTTDEEYSQDGDPYGRDWVPAECDVSIRPGWFWHSSEHPKSAFTLLDIYYKSVGRNCLLILNVPPNSSGLISDEDLQVLQDFTTLRQIIFSQNLAQDAIITADSTRGGTDHPQFSPSNILQEGIYTYWAPDDCQDNCAIYLDLGKPVLFNVLQVQEPIHLGQRVAKFQLDIYLEGEFFRIANGTTIGYKRLLQFDQAKAQYLRFLIEKSRAEPLISYFGIYLDPFTSSLAVANGTRESSFNESQAIELRTSNHSHRKSISSM